MKLMDYQILTKYNIILKSHQSLLKEERERGEKLLAVYNGSKPNWQKEDMHRLITDHKQITRT